MNNIIEQASRMTKIFRGYFCPGDVLTGSSVLSLLTHRQAKLRLNLALLRLIKTKSN